jgi:hypothetical protein
MQAAVCELQSLLLSCTDVVHLFQNLESTYSNFALKINKKRQIDL